MLKTALALVLVTNLHRLVLLFENSETLFPQIRHPKRFPLQGLVPTRTYDLSTGFLRPNVLPVPVKVPLGEIVAPRDSNLSVVHLSVKLILIFNTNDP